MRLRPQWGVTEFKPRRQAAICPCTVYYSSNSTCSIFLWICCTTSCTPNPQQIHNFSTSPQQTTNPQQIESMEYGFRLVHNTSKSCTTNPQQIHSKSNKWSMSYKCSVHVVCSLARTIEKLLTIFAYRIMMDMRIRPQQGSL
jgi:hypothetical protein